MRKIKFLTLLALMLGSIVTTQAQEKQNDATWEETVQFLGNNISKFDHHDGLYEFEYKINKTKLRAIEESDGIVKVIYSMDLAELISIEFRIHEKLGSSILLVSTKNSVEANFFDEGVVKDSGKDSGLKINLCTKYKFDPLLCLENLWNEEDVFIQRILKAFKHLAYLANEKRKESKF